jgi:hypothetical protein
LLFHVTTTFTEKSQSLCGTSSTAPAAYMCGLVMLCTVDSQPGLYVAVSAQM